LSWIAGLRVLLASARRGPDFDTVVEGRIPLNHAVMVSGREPRLDPIIPVFHDSIIPLNHPWRCVPRSDGC